MPSIHLIVSCSKRKRINQNLLLRLNIIKQSLTISKRANLWIKLLKCQRRNQVSCIDLYSGEHWHIVRSILDMQSVTRRQIHIWVCSAGYGLVPIDTPMIPYSATFAPGEEDSVCDRKSMLTGLPEWWDLIATFKEVHTEPRTIAELAKKYPDDFILVALPDNYLIAVTNDLRTTLKQLQHQHNFAVLSAGGSVPNDIKANFLPANGTLQGIVGGSLSSLNARLARLLISSHHKQPLTLQSCQNMLDVYLEKAPKIISHSRKKLTDNEVKKIIGEYLKQNENASATQLLRQFRDSGSACEHSRFISLFCQIKDEMKKE